MTKFISKQLEDVYGNYDYYYISKLYYGEIPVLKYTLAENNKLSYFDAHFKDGTVRFKPNIFNYSDQIKINKLVGGMLFWSKY